jgi:plasmid maintenance system killer protein
MITITFEDDDLEELIKTGNNKKYKIYSRDKKFMMSLTTVYNTMCAVNIASELSSFSFLHYEKLKYVNESSVRIIQNRVERLIFRETDNGLVITLLKLDSNHYGNKK